MALLPSSPSLLETQLGKAAVALITLSKATSIYIALGIGLSAESSLWDQSKSLGGVEMTPS